MHRSGPNLPVSWLQEIFKIVQMSRNRIAMWLVPTQGPKTSKVVRANWNDPCCSGITCVHVHQVLAVVEFNPFCLTGGDSITKRYELVQFLKNPTGLRVALGKNPFESKLCWHSHVEIFFLGGVTTQNVTPSQVQAFFQNNPGSAPEMIHCLFLLLRCPSIRCFLDIRLPSTQFSDCWPFLESFNLMFAQTDFLCHHGETTEHLRPNDSFTEDRCLQLHLLIILDNTGPPHLNAIHSRFLFGKV